MVNHGHTQRAPEGALSVEQSAIWVLLGTIGGTFAVMLAAIFWASPVSVPAADIGTLPGDAWITTAVASAAAVASLFALLLNERLTRARAMVGALALLMSLGVLFGEVMASTSTAPDARDVESAAVDQPVMTEAATLCTEVRSEDDTEAGSIRI